MNSLLSSIFASIIAGLIFWLVFTQIPTKIRYWRIRPRVEYDIFEIYSKLFFHIEIVFKPNKNSGFTRQEWVKAGLLSRDDFEKWLQNKCLNESFLYDEMREYLIPIGEELATSSKTLIEKIDRSSTYFSFMKAKEILLLRTIRAKLETYSYDLPAEYIVGQAIFKPVIPNLSFMANNFYELYQCYLKLQSIVWTYKRRNSPIDRKIKDSFDLEKAKSYYYANKLKQCHIYLMTHRTIEKTLWFSQVFMCEYKQEHKKKAFNSLRALLDNTTLKPVYLRSCFGGFHTNDDVRAILLERFPKEQLLEMEESLFREENIISSATKNLEMIKTFYDKKTKEENYKGAKRETLAKQAQENRLREQE